MRKITEVLRLKLSVGRSCRQISKSCGIARSTVADYLNRAAAAGLSWPLPEDTNEATLERLLYPPLPVIAPDDRPKPNWSKVYKELKRKGVTLQLLWQEYKENNPDGYQYSRFCQIYRAWLGTQNVVMRQDHKAGEKLFVDYAGQRVSVLNRVTGEVQFAEIFVAVLGASSYTYAEATWSQKLPDWISSHIRTFNFIGGCPYLVVPDNLKSGVTKAHRYDPDINATYQDMAVHYSVAIVPARPRKPKDKSKAEAGVLLVERWILACLRNRDFFSLNEVNEAITPLLEKLNNRPFQKFNSCRKELFETLDKPCLQPLPQYEYEFAEWLKARVSPNIHIRVCDHFYSVPYTLVKKQVDVRITARIIEVLFKGKRVASHVRSYAKYGYTTLKIHMPKKHQEYADWSPERLTNWAAKLGEATKIVISNILKSRPYPQQSYNTCFGVMGLGKNYGNDRLEAACSRALVIGACNYRSIESILKKNLDKQQLPEAEPTQKVIKHSNIRQPSYFQ
ncbi:IS21 family transposase [Desulfobacterota bacterium M19]